MMRWKLPPLPPVSSQLQYVILNGELKTKSWQIEQCYFIMKLSSSLYCI